MIDWVGIYKKADKLVQQHGARDTIKLAESGVKVIPVEYFTDLLGMYVCRWKHRVMFLNDRMDEYLTLMVVGHELGHDVYHRELAKEEEMKEFELFNMHNATEYEANAFAAHILIDTDECIGYARDGYDVVQIAQMMNSEINLMLIKLQELIRLGYNILLPYEPNSDFLKNIGCIINVAV